MGLFSSLCLPIAPDRAQIAMVRTRRSSQAAPLRVAFLHPDLGLGGECRALLQVLRTLHNTQIASAAAHAPPGACRGGAPHRRCGSGARWPRPHGALWLRPCCCQTAAQPCCECRVTGIADGHAFP